MGLNKNCGLFYSGFLLSKSHELPRDEATAYMVFPSQSKRILAKIHVFIATLNDLNYISYEQRKRLEASLGGLWIQSELGLKESGTKDARKMRMKTRRIIQVGYVRFR
jgi:hypothetical protein